MARNNVARILLILFLQQDLCPAGDPAPFQLDRLPLARVSDCKALGYANNQKFLIDEQGIAYFCVRSRNGNSFNIALYRAPVFPESASQLQSVWIKDLSGLKVSSSPQRAASIELGGEFLHVVWNGGSVDQPSHQIRYARVSRAPSLSILEEIQPFTIKGFRSARDQAAPDEELWQEHPACAMGSDGALHVVWEARDAVRTSSNGAPTPGIAYATRGSNGTWSQRGELARPSYLQVDERFPSQSRPSILVDSLGSLHVICHGSVAGTQQILCGGFQGATFSGWKAISSSPKDQRHVSAAMDNLCRMHAVWREGLAQRQGSKRIIGGPIQIAYSFKDKGETAAWSKPVTVSSPDEESSCPSISVSELGVWLAWVSWLPGTANTEGMIDNGFPSDSGVVQGKLRIAFKPSAAGSFTLMKTDAPIVSYPTFARSHFRQTEGHILWTEEDMRESKSPVSLVMGRVHLPK
jgi:hypothetical protein